MRTLEQIINHRLVKAYLIANVLLANLHVGIALAHAFIAESKQQANLFHLVGIHLLFPKLGEEQFLVASYFAFAALIAVLFCCVKGLSLRLSSR